MIIVDKKNEKGAKDGRNIIAKLLRLLYNHFFGEELN
jgi:hypothetical protein